MASRRVLNSPTSENSRSGGVSSRGRRAVAAFVLGAALSIAGVAGFVASGAAARGLFQSFSSESGWGFGGGSYRPSYSVVRLDSGATAYAHSYYYGSDNEYGRSASRVYLKSDGWDDAPRRHKHSRKSAAHAQGVAAHLNYSAHEPVCVRLCDGFFFPLAGVGADEASQTSACNSLCPDAPTQVFYRNGSDKIEDSVSAKGQPYTALPVSLRYQSTADNTCSCHRDVAAYAPLSDVTLRRGDAVMTPAGFVVFKGANGAPRGAGDFSALAKSSVPASERSALQSLEKVSVLQGHPTLSDWMVSQSTSPIAKAKTPEKHASNDDKIRLLVWRGAGVD